MLVATICIRSGASYHDRDWDFSGPFGTMASSFLLPLLILSLFLAAFTSPFAVPQPDTARGSTVLIERQTNWTVGQIVNTTSGPIQGTASTLRPDVSVYLGIPFAQPPTGDLRFAAPVAVTQSSSVINATTVVRLS